MTYKSHKQLASENPGGLDCLPSPHNFSSNPGFIDNDIVVGAKQFKNPNGAKIHDDTEQPGPVKTLADVSNSHGLKLDASNPPRNEMEPKFHREEKPAPKTKTEPGRQLKQIHRSVVISEN